MLVDIMTNNTQYTTNCSNLHPTPTSDPLAKVKLAFVHRLHHQYYYPKVSTGFAPPKLKKTKPFIGFRDLITELQGYAQYSIKMR